MAAIPLPPSTIRYSDRLQGYFSMRIRVKSWNQFCA